MNLYDALGNPLNYMGASIKWDVKGNLTSVPGRNGRSAEYTYLSNGQRYTKTTGGKKTTYLYNNGLLLSETTGNETIHYYYDSDGTILGIGYKKGTSAEKHYFLEKNVIAVYRNSDNVLVGTYEYDLWGNPISVKEAASGRDTDGILQKNPFRYRCYYYDSETGFYYMSSRYYDPVIRRWISPEPNVYSCGFDSGAGVIGYNVYAYCINSPVNYFDYTGEFVVSTLLICVAVGAIIGGTIGGVVGNAYANHKGYTGSDKTKTVLAGIGIGGLAVGALGYVAAPTVVSVTGVAGVSVSSAGISTTAAVGTSFGKLGTLIENEGQQLIDWNKTSWHALKRMAERGVTQNMMEVWAKTGKALQQSGNKVLYVTKQGVVAIDEVGKVITAYTSDYFDDNMKKVIETLFGR